MRNASLASAPVRQKSQGQHKRAAMVMRMAEEPHRSARAACLHAQAQAAEEVSWREVLRS